MFHPIAVLDADWRVEQNSEENQQPGISPFYFLRAAEIDAKLRILGPF